ncbi:ATP-grasp domain-containing protein [Pseudonocardia acaciae]|uniref:ATP-grasp domain-containing protein n=1 Tax=Pseudonocardia acaciae TaxID=551276 RepID=UPI00048BE779|nr:ATP-grasp domain-containing protein [Pseudonocardia acaciae]
MNVLLSTIGKRGYIARYFREVLPPGSRIIGTGNSPHTPGFWACDESVVLPDIPDPSYLDRVLETITAHDVHAAFTLSDLDLGRLAHARDTLIERGVAAFFPGPEEARVSLDKLRTHEALTALGFSCPATTTSVDEALGWGPPLFVKPRFGSASAGIHLARTEEEIAFFMTHGQDMIAQPYLRGVEMNAEVCCDLEGDPVRACLWRKLESRGGETLLAQTLHDDAVLRTAIEVAAEVRIPGPSDLDLMLVDDEVVVIEINARFGGGYPASHLAGADFVAALVDIASGRRVAPDFGYQPGIMMTKELRPFAYPADRPAPGTRLP